MEIRELKRMDTSIIEKVKTISDLRRDLAASASEKLGYHRLKRALTPGVSLLTALTKLDITPFSRRSVDAYKASKEFTGTWSGTKQCIGGIVASFSLAPPAYWLWNHVPEHQGWKTLAMIIASMLISVMGIIAFGVTIGARDDIGHGNRKVIRWNRVSISQFEGDIPDHALSKALEIKEAFPASYLYVEYLHENNQSSPSPMPDPFLVVTHGAEEYYVDVWDEKKYEETL